MAKKTRISILDLKPKAISTDLRDKYIFLYGEEKIGKAQPINTLIPTPEGIRPLGDIKVDGCVYNRFGNPVKVLGVYPQGYLDNYEVVLEDGRKTRCNDQHLWSCYTLKGNLETLTLREMIDQGIHSPNSKDLKYFIPMNEAVEYEKKSYMVDPYIVGAFLGNDAERASILSIDDEELLYHIDEVCFSAHPKRIPIEYKNGSIEQRYSLIQGLMDTNGKISEIDFAVKFTSVNLELVQDLQEVFYSLGYRCSIKENKTTKKCYTLFIDISNQDKYKIFRFSHKKEIAFKAYDVFEERRCPKIGIKEVNKLPQQEEMMCIYVEDREHLYLTNDCIVTHNTTFAAQCEGSLILEFEKGTNMLSNITSIPVPKWIELKAILKELELDEAKEMYKTIVFDTIGVAWEICTQYVIDQYNSQNATAPNFKKAKGVGDLPFGQGYGLVDKEMGDMLRAISMLGYGVILIGHKQVKTYQDTMGKDYEVITPNLNNRAKAIINAFVDIIAYVGYKELDNGTRKRVIRTRGTKNIVAGSRSPYLAEEIDFSYKDIVAALGDAIKQSENLDGAILVEKMDEYSAFGDRKFEDVVAEVRTLCEEKKDKSNQIAEAVQKVFGYMIKLDDVIPSQKDNLELLLLELGDI